MTTNHDCGMEAPWAFRILSRVGKICFINKFDLRISYQCLLRIYSWNIHLNWISCSRNIADNKATTPLSWCVGITAMNQESIVNLHMAIYKKHLDTYSELIKDKVLSFNFSIILQCVLLCILSMSVSVNLQTFAPQEGGRTRPSLSQPAPLGFLDWHSACCLRALLGDEAKGQSSDFLLENEQNLEFRPSL